MNATALAQSEFDNRLPPPVSESPLELARAEWLYNAVEQLVTLGCDVKVQRRLRKPQVVKVAQLALAADEVANNRQANCEVGTPALGWLLIANNSGRADKVSTAELLGRSDHPFGKLGEIAEALLRPLADDALAAQAEDAEL
ncbi:hypothetical protein LS633_00445 [Pseudomonas sp. NIBR-H-19]|uniref:hypothetical protein n=1 Tax=Pseudomonas sp. NIBR-H-19 TaxID=2901380 RepID=UPI001E2BBEC5|nr:hypothetical protein [Pseudomonas sp. NIBR-H-19]UHC81700.1 hypothetical protein LS633_25375 [Pseudomonas sp. NIBR-H-19]UHC82282.1 hypothetical protein LS633_00110 [Pseudomonas sp. NIBR-H-19]UHC82349.1 hypothetical protein LS633_00445 [Pseudomonas sp. NIBR-H-19]